MQNPQGDDDVVSTSSSITEKSITQYETEMGNSPSVRAEASAVEQIMSSIPEPVVVKTEDGDVIVGPLIAKSKVLGAKLSDYELKLYEYSTFSLSEEVDIFYCKTKNKDVFSESFESEMLTEKSQMILELLEQQIAPERKSSIIQQLYIFSMGEYRGVESRKERKRVANQILNQCDALRSLCTLFNEKIQEMGKVQHKGMHNSNLLLELELRMVCNTLINFLIYNNDDENMILQFTNLNQKVEETCLQAIQLSLDTTFVPVRKIILILHIYLRYLFGEKKEDPNHKEFYKNLKYMPKYIDYQFFEKVPRNNLNSDSPVEQFYKRNMNKNHPIPHIIVVGILRVLLSTCPNTKKNTTGGVHIHREWGSCLKLYLVNKDFFDDNGFKSEIFDHSSLEKEHERRQKEDANGSDDEDALKDEDLFELYRYENDRHRVIAAMIISDLFIYMLKHFKANCINQSIYLSQLLVDANGVLVLLKFLNQGFEKFQFDQDQQLDQNCPFLQLNEDHDLNTTIEETVSQLLRLTYKLCRNQKERIKSFLIQYKGCLIMKKLINKFTRPDLRKNAAKVIKIQIRQISKAWRKDNMKIISTVYQHVQLKNLDDWLGWKREKESGLTCPDRDVQIEEEKLWFTQEQIRQLNADFNYENYEQFYEKNEEDESEEDTKRKKRKPQKPQENDVSDGVSKENLLYQMEKKVKLEPHMMKNYEQWLEDEVWSYFD